MSALTEISGSIPAVPASGGNGAVEALRRVAENACAAIPDAVSFLRASLDILDRRAEGGAPFAQAALSLLTPDVRLCLPAVAADLAAMTAERSLVETQAGSRESGGPRAGEEPDPCGEPKGLSQSIYALAVRLDGAGRSDEARLLLAALAANEWGELDGCLGLAAVATRLGRFAAAKLLAQRCLAADRRHPRALCILGIAELEEGSLEMAQTYLAMAARLARNRVDFRADLQAAQRALLLMHLDGSAN